MLRFQKRDPDKIQERERIVEEAKSASDDTVKAASICLQNEEFAKYRREYQRLERCVIEELILVDQTIDDPVKYGFMCKDVVAKLRYIGAFLRGVEQEAGRRA